MKLSGSLNNQNSQKSPLQPFAHPVQVLKNHPVQILEHKKGGITSGRCFLATPQH